ncbi:hypothetical protein BGZ73_007706 [Actinomortierella ambigua]|nr:hypothetical protein BGZ73_007706 [Actinomortierella ambigua]
MAPPRKRANIDDDDSDDNYGSSNRVSKRGTAAQSSGSQKRRLRREDSDSIIDLDPSTKQVAIEGLEANPRGLDDEDKERLVKDVVRLAIFTSHSDVPLKRDDIREVLGDHSRMFDTIFGLAQQRLRDIFGMEMVELSVRSKASAVPGGLSGASGTANNTATGDSAAGAAGSSDAGGSKGPAGSKSYILRTTLPQELVASSVIDQEADLESVGLLMVILSLIMVRNGAIYESALMSHLRRLSLLEDNSYFGDVTKKLDQLIKKRYLERIKLAHLDESGEKAEMEYRWGSRAHVEYPKQYVVEFIKDVFGDDAPQSLTDSIRKAAGMEVAAKTNANN